MEKIIMLQIQEPLHKRIVYLQAAEIVALAGMPRKMF